jgi:type I restriction enzyme M protein
MHLDPPEPEADETEDGEEDAAETPEATPRVPRKTIKKLLDPATWSRDGRLHRAAEALIKAVGEAEHDDYAVFEAKVQNAVKAGKLAVTPAETRLIARAMSWRSLDAKPIVKAVHKLSAKPADPQGGFYAVNLMGKAAVVTYEPDKALSDTEIVAFGEPGGINAFFEREVAPHATDSWIDRAATKIGYEISFARHFYKPKPPRPLAEIKAEIDLLERQTQALLDAVLVEADA